MRILPKKIGPYRIVDERVEVKEHEIVVHITVDPRDVAKEAARIIERRARLQ